MEPAAVGQSIEVQIYDPAYIETGTTCGDLSGLTTNGINEYAPDASSRYAGSGNTFCPGDYGYGTSNSTAAPDTTFLVREQTDTGDPMKGAVISGCTKQFRGVQRTPTLSGAAGPPPTAALSQWSNPPLNTTTRARYNPELTRVFHQWVSLCTFTAQRSGDYFLQVRTNVSLGGTATPNTNAAGVSYDPMVYSGKTTAGNQSGDTTSGFGLNAFALRALPSSASFRDDIAVAGYSRMPIYQNSPGSTATFNLVRALPGTRGQYITFDFFDAADATGAGTVKVSPPAEATWDGKSGTNITGCRSAINSGAYTTLPATCSTSISSSANNGKVHHLIIPIPPTYSCNPTTLGGCWFKVQITFTGATSVTDFTTWVANIGGDPVRLIE